MPFNRSVPYIGARIAAQVSRLASTSADGFDASRYAHPGPTIDAALCLAQLLREQNEAQLPQIVHARIFSLLVALRPEVTRIAVLTAISASAANALLANASEAAEHALVRFYPASSARLILASTRYRRIVADDQVSKNLINYNELLCAAMQQTIALTAHRACDDRAGAASVDRLSGAWHGAACAVHKLLIAIDDKMAEYHVNGRASEHELLLQALDAVCAGGTPFMSSAGTFAMPDWAELRREPRMAVDCHGVLEIEASRHHVRITDLSTLGAGIEGAGQLQDGLQAILLVTNGIALPARVIWSNPLRAGLSFDRRLADDSPAFRFLAQTADRA